MALDRTADVEDPGGELDASDEADIRYSLTALGEAYLTERGGRRFRGFGPCAVAAFPAAAR